CHAEVNLSGATCLKLDITFGRERMSLLAIYRSPSGDLDSFISDLEFLDGKLNIETNDINNVANTLNEYYVRVGANLASAVPPVTEVVMNDED
ncbi:hypothetical protein J6590_096978, partial [Homalodisca vitripennis]